ncbi:tributyrin esterase [Spirochaetia bacterium]|nr:tributyrin esterase [Spirochaetia bacterium]
MALFHIRYYSELNSYDTDMDVILPENRKTCPVLYLLHDLGGNQTSWQRHTSIERYALEKGIAVVMPSGLDRWYTDVSLAGGFFDNYHRFFVYELISICRSFFPQFSSNPRECFIGGAGMGGYGALKLALLHPDVYGAAISIDGYTDIVKKIEKAKDTDEEVWLTDVFGDPQKVPGSDNNLFALAEKEKKGVQFFLVSGSKNARFAENQALAEVLQKKGTSVNFTAYSQETSWQVWDGQIEEAIRRLPYNN